MKIKQRFYPEPGQRKNAWGYCRVSHKGQYDRGNSLEDQERRIQAYYNLHHSDPAHALSVVQWGGMVTEPRATSAYSRSLASREGGKQLMSVVQPGDHVIVDKLDRIFRSVEDFAIQRRWFRERGISIHFLNILGVSLDTESMGGEVLVYFLVLSAEAEARRISERVCAARASLSARGFHGGGKKPFFFDLVGQTPGKKAGSGGKLVWNPTWLTVAQDLEAAPSREARRAIITTFCGHRPSNQEYMRVRNCWRFYQAWLAADKPDINTLKIKDFVREYRAKKKREDGDGKADV